MIKKIAFIQNSIIKNSIPWKALSEIFIQNLSCNLKIPLYKCLYLFDFYLKKKENISSVIQKTKRNNVLFNSRLSIQLCNKALLKKDIKYSFENNITNSVFRADIQAFVL